MAAFENSTYLPEGCQHPLIIGQRVLLTLQRNCQRVLDNLYRHLQEGWPINKERGNLLRGEEGFQSGGWRVACFVPLYGVDVSREENEILDSTLILTAHSQSKTQDLESEVKLVQESATRDLKKLF